MATSTACFVLTRMMPSACRLSIIAFISRQELAYSFLAVDAAIVGLESEEFLAGSADARRLDGAGVVEGVYDGFLLIDGELQIA